MKTAQELVEGLERVERQEHPSDKVAAWEAFVDEIQLDACQSQAERILTLIAARGIDVTDCDGDDDTAVILANWIVGRIEEADERHANLVNQF
jgi:hypothetical protein